ncbi:hypothetical protein BZG77_14090, partial [Salinivibrio sp. IB643]
MNNTLSPEVQHRDLETVAPTKERELRDSRFINQPYTDHDQCDLFIYCPHEDIDDLVQVLERHPDLRACINCYEVQNLKNKTLCHFKSAKLSTQQQEFLIVPRRLGAWVEPLVSYFDRTLGYTETELLHSGYFLHQKA